MSFTASPASRSALAVPPVEMSSIPACGQNLGEGNQAGFVGNGKQCALNFCHSTTKSPKAADAAIGKSRFRIFRLYPVRADGALESGAGGVVVVQRLNLRRARLRE